MDDIRDLTDNRFRAQIPTFEEAQLLITKRVVHKSKMIEMERLSPMKTENDQTIFFSKTLIPRQKQQLGYD